MRYRDKDNAAQTSTRRLLALPVPAKIREQLAAQGICLPPDATNLDAVQAVRRVQRGNHKNEKR